MRQSNQSFPVCGVLVWLGVGGLTVPAFAQATRPVGPSSAQTQPAMSGASAVVEAVQGTVYYTAPSAGGNAPAGKQKARKGDRLAGGTTIQTLPRSYVVLVFGNDTVVKIDPLTLASIDQFVQSGDGKNISLGLGHGMIRAGSAAPTLRSEMTISSPIATLSKRGTYEFGLRYEGSMGRFRAYLTESGLIQVLNRNTGVSRRVEPTQYVTQAMVRWIETAMFNREVPVQDVFGLTANERSFAARSNTGAGIADPGGGAFSNAFGGRTGSQVTGGVSRRLPSTPLINQQPQGPQVIGRPEGNFGARR